MLVLGNKRKIAAAAALTSALTLSLAACQGGLDFSQMSAVPKLDSSVFVPDPSQFARKERARAPTTPGDLVDAGGRCAADPAPAAPAEQVEAPASPNAAPPPTNAVPTTTERRIGLEMTECEVVHAAGTPAEVQITANERGERSVVMTYAAADRPIYHFVEGRLKTIERGAEPPPPEPVRKKKTPQRSAKRQTNG
jgi:hypothetical protein